MKHVREGGRTSCLAVKMSKVKREICKDYIEGEKANNRRSFDGGKNRNPYTEGKKGEYASR